MKPVASPSLSGDPGPRRGGPQPASASAPLHKHGRDPHSAVPDNPSSLSKCQERAGPRTGSTRALSAVRTRGWSWPSLRPMKDEPSPLAARVSTARPPAGGPEAPTGQRGEKLPAREPGRDPRRRAGKAVAAPAAAATPGAALGPDAAAHSGGPGHPAGPGGPCAPLTCRDHGPQSSGVCCRFGRAVLTANSTGSGPAERRGPAAGPSRARRPRLPVLCRWSQRRWLCRHQTVRQSARQS